MLPKGARLSKHQVEYVLSHGKRVSSRYFLATVSGSCGVLPEEKSPRHSAYAAVVSKKTAPTAVERNSCRRRMYNAIRASSSSLSRPLCLVVVAKKETKQAPYAALVDDMRDLLASLR